MNFFQIHPFPFLSTLIFLNDFIEVNSFFVFSNNLHLSSYLEQLEQNKMISINPLFMNHLDTLFDLLEFIEILCIIYYNEFRRYTQTYNLFAYLHIIIH